ncbi:hypothetical protein HRR83_009420 [Exophiala dermatitidis]|uniref:Uncharacterized protein n=1 Tax=Exophiala dermatitidis TaxID=5970 RepID=A0AAN6IPH0_EXODE|nr:hypothetical protein HRR73_009291 [Exophiala dermatitidis]KAJ4515202.1 hypothetical protein HRR74_005668 [Exophiala dermatitidis]KAJ4548544.1 hypothetical protein HRR76_001137 [Exophiala dermatitidis]KAJ4552736.1 hypothetical protein HRR77_002734 [Exophiala dermatitidis]KAJ4554876.1 hypothetical protein HRR79_009317 [Exophiala dermatitidis]
MQRLYQGDGWPRSNAVAGNTPCILTQLFSSPTASSTDLSDAPDPSDDDTKPTKRDVTVSVPEFLRHRVTRSGKGSALPACALCEVAATTPSDVCGDVCGHVCDLKRLSRCYHTHHHKSHIEGGVHVSCQERTSVETQSKPT